MIKRKIMKMRDMTSKSTNFEEELNKSLTQEEKDLLQPIMWETEEINNQRRMEELNEEYLQGDLEEYYEFLDEEKILQDELERELEKLVRTKIKKSSLRM